MALALYSWILLINNPVFAPIIILPLSVALPYPISKWTSLAEYSPVF